MSSPSPRPDNRAPYRLRLLLDVSLTEKEWGLLSQAYVPDAPAERALAVLVIDRASPWASAELQGGPWVLQSADESVSAGEVLATLAATPARLELNLGRAKELENNPPEGLQAISQPVDLRPREPLSPLDILKRATAGDSVIQDYEEPAND